MTTTTTTAEPGASAFARPGFVSTMVYDQFDITDAAFYAAQAEAKETFQRYVATPAPLLTFEAVQAVLPPGAEIRHDTTSAARRHTYARTDLGGILVIAERHRSVILVSAASAEVADGLREQVRHRVPTRVPDDGHAPVLVSFNSPDGTESQLRNLQVPAWSEISANYPTTVREHLDELMATRAPEGSARLVLWHGEPGTGKTTALRALIRSWKHWCSARYVMDPERAFGDPGYLMDLLAPPAHRLDTDVDPDDAWQLIIAEDADEFLRGDARQAAGAALGRLLNLSDGILGQGSNTLILLTTNEPVSRLHPALIRPGRCLARIEFSRFSPEAAQAWLGDHAQVDHAVTLAELYERKGALARINTTRDEPASTGQYL